MNIFQELQKQLGDRVKKDEPIGKYTTFKIGGPADWFFDAKTTDELVKGVTVGRSLKLPITILGGGTNILIGDRGIRGFVIKNSGRTISMKGARGTRSKDGSDEIVFVEVDSGVVMNQLVRITVDEGLQGLEMQLGLPGTVGGAVYMNSKWTHPTGYVGDAVFQAKILTPTGEVRIVPQSYFHFAYDTSILQKSGDIVLTVVFTLKRMDPGTLWKIANESIRYRRETQPQGIHSPGCTFRNISQAEALSIPTPNHTTSAGFLVDHAGCKDMQVGDARVSPVHANFIINTGEASARDVVQLIDKIKARVKAKFGVTLEEEIVRIGEF